MWDGGEMMGGMGMWGLSVTDGRGADPVNRGAHQVSAKLISERRRVVSGDGAAAVARPCRRRDGAVPVSVVGNALRLRRLAP